MAGETSGRDLYIQVDSGAGYVTIAGCRAKSISKNNEAIDITNDDSAGWRELLAEPGSRTVEISVSGITKDSVLLAAISASTSTLALQDCKIVYPDGSFDTGNFFLSSVTKTGEYNGAVTFEATLQNAASIGGLALEWIDSGMTAAWLMSETSGPSLLPTIGSNNLTGSGALTYGNTITGYARTGVDFSAGTSDVTGVEADFDTSGGTFSFTALIETGASVAGIQRLCLVLGSAGAAFNLFIETGELKFQNYASGTISTGLTVSANTVYKVAATMDAAAETVNVYRDTSSDLNTGVTGINGSYGTFTYAKFGSQGGLPMFQFSGKMACAAVSTAALTTAQVQAIFNNY